MVGQRTLKNTIRATGVGLHTGKKVLMTLRPAAPDEGIIFRRTDLAQMVDIRATAENVGDTMLGTTLGRTIRDFRNALRNAQDEARETFSELTGGALEATNEFRQALPSPDMFSDTPATPTYTYDAPAAPAPVESVPAASASAEMAPAADEDPASLATEPTAEAARIWPTSRASRS